MAGADVLAGIAGEFMRFIIGRVLSAAESRFFWAIWLLLFAALLFACSSGAHGPAAGRAENTGTAAGERDFSMSQKRLLEIVDEQEKLFAKLDSNSRMAGSDLISQKSRVDGMWRDYIARNPRDFDALAIYGKYLRDTGSSSARDILERADKLGRSAAVKHQLAACFAEEGRFGEAFKYAKESVEADPDGLFYLLQAAQLSAVVREPLVEDGIVPRAEIDSFIFKCYSRAASLRPRDRRIQTDFALSFYDYEKPDWNAALAQWDRVIPLCALGIERQTALANKARVLVELNRDAEAAEILKSVNLKPLERAKALLIGEIGRAAAERSAKSGTGD